MFFYAFEIIPENEKAFKEYMEKYGSPVMSKYCKNWRFFKLNQVLSGKEIPQYIGVFEIPDIEKFLGSEPPEEMKEAMQHAAKITTNNRDWIALQVASNI